MGFFPHAASRGAQHTQVAKLFSKSDPLAKDASVYEHEVAVKKEIQRSPEDGICHCLPGLVSSAREVQARRVGRQLDSVPQNAEYTTLGRQQHGSESRTWAPGGSRGRKGEGQYVAADASRKTLHSASVFTRTCKLETLHASEVHDLGRCWPLWGCPELGRAVRNSSSQKTMTPLPTFSTESSPSSSVWAHFGLDSCPLRNCRT